MRWTCWLLRPALVTVVLGLSDQGYGGMPLPWALHGAGLPGCLLFTSPEVVLTAPTGSAGPGRGYASVDLPLPLVPAPGRFTLHGQWLVFEASPAGLGGVTDALRWRH